MSKFFLFGSLQDIEDLSGLVEICFGASLKRRDSSYWGEYFSGETTEGLRLQLKRNLDPIDGGVVEEKFPGYKALLYVTSDSDFDLSLAALSSEFCLLQIDRSIQSS